LRLHRNDLVRLEPESFEIREAPIRFAQIRCELDALTVRFEASILMTRRLQRMSIAQPYFRIARILLEHFGINCHRLIVFTDAAQQRGLQIPIARIARIVLE
jgi:hypothetical protein